MLKNNKGITLIAMGVTIIVILVLVTITLDSGRELIKNSEKNKLKTTLLLIQSRAESLLEQYLFDYDDPLSEEITAETKEQYLAGAIINNYSDVRKVGFEPKQATFSGKYIYCKWGENTLKSQGIDVSNVSPEDYFIIQYDPASNSVDVASVKGFTIEDKKETIHMLSEF